MIATIHTDMTIDDYHAFASERVWSKSNLKEMIPPTGCPALFRYHYMGAERPEKKQSAAMTVGKLVHTLALEPHLFAESVYVLPEGVKCDARQKEYQSHIAEAAGREIINAKDMADIEGMAESLTRNAFAMSLLKAPGNVEASIFWTDEATGHKLRCRPDFLRDDGLIVDLKTTATVRPDMFRKTAFDLAYDVSVALTCRGYEALTGKRPDNYVFLAVEKSPPYLIECYDTFRSFDMELSYLDGGELRLQQALMLLTDCIASDRWPGYCGGITPMEYPVYAKKFIPGGEDADEQ